MGIIMTKKITIYGALIVSLFAITIFAPVFSLAATRTAVLSDFLKSNQNLGTGGFYDNKIVAGGTGQESVLATRSAIVSLNLLGSTSLDQNRVEEWLQDQIDIAIDDKDLVSLAYSLEALDQIDEINLVQTATVDQIKALLVTCKDNYGTFNAKIGYGTTAAADASVVGTFFAVKIFYHLNLVDSYLLSTITNISAYIMGCYDTTGGFNASLTTGSPQLINTYYALGALDYLNNVQILGIKKPTVRTFIESFYVENINEPLHNGGYSFYPEDEIPFTTFLATFCAWSSLQALYAGWTPESATNSWILNHQNDADGGFTENVLPGEERTSSCLTSYYAVKMIEYSPGLASLNTEFLGFDIEWWFYIVVSVAIAVAIVVGVIIHKRRTTL
jgi:prenyltransferase beta subunit